MADKNGNLPITTTSAVKLTDKQMKSAVLIGNAPAKKSVKKVASFKKSVNLRGTKTTKMKKATNTNREKTLAYYKSRYKNAKTTATRSKIMNFVMMNMSHDDQQKFVKWQTSNK